MRYTRLIIGLVVISFGLWIVIGEQLAGASGNAFLNAQVVTVRTERAGIVAISERDLGSRVSKGEPLGRVSDALVDLARLNDLAMDWQFLSSELENLETQLEKLIAARNAAKERSAVYQKHRLGEIATRLKHARNRLAILAGEISPTSLELTIANSVDERVDRVPGSPTLAALAIEHAKERVDVLETELAAAKSGVYLGDGYNDAPFSEQQTLDLNITIGYRMAKLDELRNQLAILGKRQSKERLRTTLLSEGSLSSPVNGFFWEALATDGVAVQRGDPTMRLVDCETIIVSLSVSESVYDRLKLGQLATFRFSGDSRRYSGIVTRLGGSGAAKIYETLAIAPSQKHLDRYDVTLKIDEFLKNYEKFCLLGRTGRVFFESRPLDTIRLFLQR